MQDVELHELHGVFHAGRAWRPSVSEIASSSESAHDPPVSQSRRAKRRRAQREEGAAERALAIRRTCWRRTMDDTDGEHYAEGVGVADWLSRMY